MFNRFIKVASDLVTTHDQIRAGFLSIALEKNRVSDPYVKNALAFKTMVQGANDPEDFLNMPKIRPFLLTASGLSDKAMQHLRDNDQTAAIKELIEKFLKPAGENYVDEVIYRYLLIKGDAVGGVMRNRIGVIGQEKLIRAILSCINVRGINYSWMKNNKQHNWLYGENNDIDIEKEIKALHWMNKNGSRILIFNMKVPVVKKNIDICLFDGKSEEFNRGKIVQKINKAIMFGELKGGIDPAGADEHWKTANTALDRIRESFNKVNHPVMTSFVGAAIENSMAVEIFSQLQNKKLTNAANLTNSNQLTEYCNWLLDI